MAGSPFVVDITPLKRQPGTQRPFLTTIEPSKSLGLVTAEVEATELAVDLQLEIAGEELVVRGCIDVSWCGPCRRCLGSQVGSTPIELQEIFQKVAVEGETWPLDEDQADLEPMVRELVLLHLPVAPLCREDCAGPDPGRFPTSVESDEARPPADPRWAALQDLNFDE